MTSSTTHYRSCVDQITTLRLIVEQSLEWNSSFYINFIDYEKAFDSVDRDMLWKIMRHYGIPEKIVNLVRSLCWNQLPGVTWRTALRTFPDQHRSKARMPTFTFPFHPCSWLDSQRKYKREEMWSAMDTLATVGRPRFSRWSRLDVAYQTPDAIYNRYLGRNF